LRSLRPTAHEGVSPVLIVAVSSPADVHNASDRTLPNSLSVWGTQMGYDAITYVIKEFWPTFTAR